MEICLIFVLTMGLLRSVVMIGFPQADTIVVTRRLIRKKARFL